MNRPALSLVIPVYNERESIGRVIAEWDRVLTRQEVSHEIVLCEDGSTDGTIELIHRLAKKYPIVVNHRSARRGYGPAVLDGIRQARGTYVLCIDSDGQCDPQDFARFWRSRGTEKVLIGWRQHRADTRQRLLFSRAFFYLFSLLFPNTLHDPSAPYVLFRPTLVEPYLHDATYLTEGFWWGFVGMCVKHRIYLQELPIAHRERTGGKTRVYTGSRIPGIAIRNIVGLARLRIDVV